LICLAQNGLLIKSHFTLYEILLWEIHSRKTNRPFTNAGFEMSALQGNTFDREYTAEVSADG
jgi:hypothetical protein